MTAAEELRLAAIHESGHAALAEVLGVAVVSAVIMPDPQRPGHAIGSVFLDAAGAKALDSFDYALIFLAGPMAEEAYRSQRDAHEQQPIATTQILAGSVWEAAGVAPGQCKAEVGDTEPYEALPEHLKPVACQVTQTILWRHWPAVEAIANELQAAGRLSGQQVRDTLKQTKVI